MAIGSPHCVSTNVGKLFGFRGVKGVEGLASVRGLEDAELRASDVDCRVAGPVPELWSVSEPFAEAAEALNSRELPECDDRSLPPPALGLWLAALQASHAGCRVSGRGEVGEACVVPALAQGVVESTGPLLCPLELKLAGDEARLLREAALLMLVVLDFATLAPSSSSSS